MLGAIVAFMASHNQYHGYIKLPNKKLQELPIRLDFNGHIHSEPGGTKLEGFSLRLFVLKKKIGSKQEHPEMSVTLRPEEWLDLIDAMKQEFESVYAARKKFDDLR